MLTQKQIAKKLEVSPATISRELKRNTGLKGYRYKQAHDKATVRRIKASGAAKRMTPEVLELIMQMLNSKWSPEQISGRLKLDSIFISHESIYRYIWQDKKNGGSLYKGLRRSGKKYNRRNSGKAGRGCIPNRIDIKERPSSVELKEAIGDWEGDTIIGAKHKGAIVSMVDRKSKFTKLRLSANKTAELVTIQVEKCFRLLPAKAKNTLTLDNGKEFSLHGIITKNIGIKCYFATPYHSWERGLNEHTNGLVRQYFPKSCDFAKLTNQEVQYVEDQLNNRPRKVLGFKTPREVFYGLQHSTKIALRG
jgi:IS30 family transposase